MELTHQPLIYLFNHVLDNDIQKCIDNFILFEVKQAKDDYVVKPFSLDELSARVAAHIRRDQRGLTKTKTKFENDLTIDYAAKGVCFKDVPVALAKKEFEIIELLSLNSGQVFDKERIYEKLWGYDSTGDASVVAEHIRKIRAKLAAVGVKPHIETVWGVGYKWVK